MFPKIHISIERWRKNEEYGVYVSNMGRVRALRTKEDLNARINQSGYSIVFTDKGSEFVHRLVAYTWLGGERNNNYNVDHINNNKRDNSVKNLRWVQKQVNTEYSSYVLINNALTVTEKQENPTPICAVEKDEDIIMNAGIKKDIRVAALKRMMNNGDAVIEINTKDNKQRTTCTSFSEARHWITMEAKIAYNGTQDNFNKNIIIAIAMNKPYMGYLWKFKKIK